ncbi:uncharacterized protein [Palaemon carinicauda]|uniref:uncharacterized protein n=1 Tax=Palaemon carinicauda TaxID=392227 RepID=UPI0035B63C9C
MKTVLLACLSFAAVAAFPEASSIGPRKDNDVLMLTTRIYSRTDGRGNYVDIYQYIPDLYGTGYNDDIESVYQTGMWMYYENNNYNTKYSGRVYFAHGIGLGVNFPRSFKNAASSIRFAGNRNYPGANTWIAYEGDYFTGQQFYGETDAYSLEYLDLKVSSFIITGSVPWTIYSGQSFTGDTRCVYPNEHDTGYAGDYLNFGIYPTMSDIGIRDNTIRSVRMGCWSNNVVKSSKVKYEHRSKNGGWGYADL